jgi:micrococcal nuclease
VTGIIDGDTLDTVIDVGFRLTTEQRVRLLAVNTPELRARDPAERAAAQQARTFVVDWVAQHAAHAVRADWPFVVHTEKSDVFGRYLAHFTCAAGHSLNDDLLAAGLAVPFPE